jgi:hypothetical protein
MKPTSFVLNVDSDGVVAASEFSTLLPLCGIYVMLHSAQIIRVGESSSGMSRLKKGFRDPLRRMLRGKERKNYIAYSWRQEKARRHSRLRTRAFGECAVIFHIMTNTEKPIWTEY